MLDSSLEERVGHPLALWNALKDRVQQENLTAFSDVTEDFLGVLWCLDQYRVSGVPPRGMGKEGQSDTQRLSGAYRMKGGWFADLITLLLQNQTSSPLAPRSNIEGFSQTHQIDIAWPASRDAPLVCVETKVMGGPAYDGQPARPATADFTNRRKELKFQATDLKLFRREERQKIDHWDIWRKVAPPSVYFMWCARLKPPRDSLRRMIGELRVLTETYLDGAGLFAYIPNAGNTGYEVVPMTQRDRVVELSDLVHRVAEEIEVKAKRGLPPDPEPSQQRPPSVDRVEPDQVEPGE